MDNFDQTQYQDPTPPGMAPAPEPDQTQQEAAPLLGVDGEIAGMVMARFKASEEWRQNYRLEWDQATNHYEMIYDDSGKEDWQSTTFQPMTTTHVERATATLHNMSMGAETPVEYQARNPGDEKTVEDTNELIQHDLERSDFKVHWTDFLRSCALYGTAIGRVEYAKETAMVMVKERKRSLFGGVMAAMARMFGGAPAPAEQESFTPKEMLVRDWATFKNVDLYSIYPQPHTEDFGKDFWVIEKDKITNREIVEGAMLDDEFYRLENVTPELLASGQERIRRDQETQGKLDAQNDRDVSLPSLDPDLEHERYCYYGPVPKWMLQPELKDDPVQKYLTTHAWLWVIDGRYVVRKKLNPYHDAEPPYVKGDFIRRNGQFYGIGIGKLLNGLQIEKNEIRNTRTDNINLMLNKIVGFLKDKVAKEDIQRLVSGPGALWAFEGIDDIRKAFTPVEFPDITQDSWRGSAEVDREAQEATDVVKTTQTIGAGEDQAGNGTFRGQLLNQQTSNETFILRGRILEIMGLRKAIKKIYSRIYQFKKFDAIEEILGKARAAEFQLVPPDQLESIAKLVTLGSLTSENKGVKLAQMRDFWVLAAQEPWFKKIEFARKMYRLMGTGSDPDEVIWSDQEVQQYNEAKRQMLSTLGPLPGAGAPGGGGNPGAPGAQPGIPGGPNGMGSPPPGPVAGGAPGPAEGLPRPSMPARGPGASPIDLVGRPAA